MNKAKEKETIETFGLFVNLILAEELNYVTNNLKSKSGEDIKWKKYLIGYQNLQNSQTVIGLCLWFYGFGFYYLERSRNDL